MFKMSCRLVCRYRTFFISRTSKNHKIIILSVLVIIFLLLCLFFEHKSKKLPIIDVPIKFFKPPGPFKSVIDHPISPKSQTLFLEFGALRMTIPAIILISASDSDFVWKLKYLNASLNFITDRLKNLALANEKFEPIREELTEVDYKLEFLKKSNSRRKINLNNFGELQSKSPNFEPFLESLGDWYRTMKNLYNTEMAFEIKECSKRLRDLENQIAHRIYQVQHGELCEQSSGLLQLR